MRGKQRNETHIQDVFLLIHQLYFSVSSCALSCPNFIQDILAKYTHRLLMFKAKMIMIYCEVPDIGRGKIYTF